MSARATAPAAGMSVIRASTLGMSTRMAVGPDDTEAMPGTLIWPTAGTSTCPVVGTSTAPTEGAGTGVRPSNWPAPTVGRLIRVAPAPTLPRPGTLIWFPSSAPVPAPADGTFRPPAPGVVTDETGPSCGRSSPRMLPSPPVAGMSTTLASMPGTDAESLPPSPLKPLRLTVPIEPDSDIGDRPPRPDPIPPPARSGVNCPVLTLGSEPRPAPGRNRSSPAATPPLILLPAPRNWPPAKAPYRYKPKMPRSMTPILSAKARPLPISSAATGRKNRSPLSPRTPLIMLWPSELPSPRMPFRPVIADRSPKKVRAPIRLITVSSPAAGMMLKVLPNAPPLIVKPLMPGMKVIWGTLMPLMPFSPLFRKTLVARKASSMPRVRRPKSPSALGPPRNRFLPPFQAPTPAPFRPFHTFARLMPLVVGAMTPMIDSTSSVMLALPWEKSTAVLISSATLSAMVNSASGPPTIIAGMTRISASQPSAFQNSSHSSTGEAMLSAASRIAAAAVLAASSMISLASSAVALWVSRPSSSSSASAAAASSAASARRCCSRTTPAYVRSADCTSTCACRKVDT